MAGKFYRCSICGNIVYLVEGDINHIVCCGKPMDLMVPGTVEASLEKHIPYVTEQDGRLTVQIGSTMHPSLDEHHIEWVAAVSDDSVKIKYLKSGKDPVVHFGNKHGKIKKILAYCNIHGLWEKEL